MYSVVLVLLENVFVSSGVQFQNALVYPYVHFREVLEFSLDRLQSFYLFFRIVI